MTLINNDINKERPDPIRPIVAATAVSPALGTPLSYQALNSINLRYITHTALITNSIHNRNISISVAPAIIN